MMTDASLPEQLWFEVRKAATMMERRAESVVMAKTGVTLGLFMVLSVLHARDTPVSQQAIADRLGLTKGTVSRLLESARREGYVTSEVATASRRERAVALTVSGRKVVDAGDAALALSDLAHFATEEPTAALAVIDGLRAFIASMEASP
ncbi:MarR family winged helix-turn-helix transcriptional regulator [Microbacterium sp. PMB16]|uniref:MarR family winged helix-turn-helix transcriptional regulator n=1 Tax=Microbacterium sp. PMB16 TaxID=3120157 RepID=UPI003F4B8BF5